MVEERIAELLAASAEKEAQALALAAVGDDVWRWCCARVGAAEANDLYQSAWVAILRGLRDFRGESSLKTWALKITRNLWHSGFRDGRRRMELMQTFFPSEEEHRAILKSRGTPFEERLIREDEARHRESLLLEAIAAKVLSEEEVDLIVYTHLLELNGEEIEALLGISDAARRKRLSRATRSFAAFIKGRESMR